MKMGSTFHTETLRPQTHLRNSFFSRNIGARNLARQSRNDLQEQRRLSNTWVSPNQQNRSGNNTTPANTIKLPDMGDFPRLQGSISHNAHKLNRRRAARTPLPLD